VRKKRVRYRKKGEVGLLWRVLGRGSEIGKFEGFRS
jgi:hypothetical protein